MFTRIRQLVVVLAFMGMGMALAIGCSKRQPDLTPEQLSGLQTIGEIQKGKDHEAELRERLNGVKAAFLALQNKLDTPEMQKHPKQKQFAAAQQAFFAELERREQQDLAACVEWAEPRIKSATLESLADTCQKEGWKKD